MTVEMVPDVSNIHMQAFEGAMNVRLGTGYANAFFNYFLGINDGIALVATDSSKQIFGYIIGGPLGCGQSMNRRLFWVASRAICLHPWLLLSQQFRSTVKARVEVMLGKSQELPLPLDLPKPVMCLMAFAVAPRFQGRGIGKHLLMAFEQCARALSMRSLGLSVYLENTGARSVYEKCGWKACEEIEMPKKTMYYSRKL